MWLLLVVSIVHSSATFGGPIGSLIGKFSDLFYSDPRRLSAVVAMLLDRMGGHRPVHAGGPAVAAARAVALRWLSP